MENGENLRAPFQSIRIATMAQFLAVQTDTACRVHKPKPAEAKAPVAPTSTAGIAHIAQHIAVHRPQP
jgi:hypothetical protein